MRDNTSDRQLVERLRKGDDTAMPELHDLYGSRIYQLAFRYMKNREDAEEITQDVLMRVFRKIDAFRGDAALSSWIYRITFNTAMSRLRSLKHRRPAEVPQETESRADTTETTASREVADWSDLADDQLLRSEMRTRLVSALSGLPDIYRAAVLLRDVQGLSTEEASAVLGVKTQTLKSRLHRGRLILRGRLADFADGLAMRSVA
ncbi:MAG: sigma-70 family RNA polymerase sigma factor [Vicinamibacterales bacterium]|jgi:RNA polymerase sigma-70 factor (ECF subfamily)|nr:sigma-70 family RNA polymerase sigma factor [Vicinamibacterales bacterium]